MNQFHPPRAGGHVGLEQAGTWAQWADLRPGFGPLAAHPKSTAATSIGLTPCLFTTPSGDRLQVLQRWKVVGPQTANKQRV